jgi:type I restriction enzyme S subunit
MLEAASRNRWERVAFGDVVRLSRERSSDPEEDGFERYLGLEHIEPRDLKVRRWGNIADGTTFTNVFRSGQVLFGKRRAYQRKVAVPDFDGVCSGDIYVFESHSERLLPELLPFICQTDGFFQHAVGTSAGSLSPRTNWDSLADYTFALPPLEDQRRLAEALGAFQIAVECQRQIQCESDRLRRSLLLDIFRPNRGSQDSFPSRWTVQRASEAGGVQLGQQRHPKFRQGSNVRPYLRVANVFDGWIDFDDVERMHFPESELHKFELLPGDILLNEGQSTELVGRSAIYRGEIPGCCFQKTLIRFRCGPGLLPEFAHAFFRHCLYTGQFASMVVQTTSMAHLTAVRFKEVPIPVPPIDEQRQLLGVMSALMTVTRAMVEREQALSILGQTLVNEVLESH